MGLGHNVLTIIFVLVAGMWLQYELKPKYSLWRFWLWLAAALAVQLSAGAVSEIIGGRLGNIVLHSVGGGVTSTFLYFYFTRTLNVRLNWRLQLVSLFAFVSSLGTLNELVEFLFQSLGIGVYSRDIQDTWRDLTANTAGAIFAYLFIRLGLWLRTSKKQR